MARKNVPASEVRAWAKEAGLTVGERGRINPDTLAAFTKANKGKTWEAKVAEVPTTTVPGVVSLDSAGRKVTKTVTIPTPEAHAILGRDGEKRGRFPTARLAGLLSAANADSVADQFTK